MSKFFVSLGLVALGATGMYFYQERAKPLVETVLHRGETEETKAQREVEKFMECMSKVK